jgi:hypothetical protein
VFSESAELYDLIYSSFKDYGGLGGYDQVFTGLSFRF